LTPLKLKNSHSSNEQIQKKIDKNFKSLERSIVPHILDKGVFKEKDRYLNCNLKKFLE
jgi:hypothetical protein